jgi:DNA-binding ferritin-like protein
MQATTGIDATRPKEIAKGLSKVLLETHTLRLQTRGLQRRLSGPMCKALRLLLGQQQEELRLGEAELATRAREVGGPIREARWPLEASSSTTMQTVDERVMGLVQAHETAARAASITCRLAEEAHDVRTCKLLARRTDVHEKAAWTLASMYVASLVSCELCAARITCPLSAVRLPGMAAARVPEGRALPGSGAGGVGCDRSLRPPEIALRLGEAPALPLRRRRLRRLELFVDRQLAPGAKLARSGGATSSSTT